MQTLVIITQTVLLVWDKRKKKETLPPHCCPVLTSIPFWSSTGQAVEHRTQSHFHHPSFEWTRGMNKSGRKELCDVFVRQSHSFVEPQIPNKPELVSQKEQETNKKGSKTKTERNKLIAATCAHITRSPQQKWAVPPLASIHIQETETDICSSHEKNFLRFTTLTFQTSKKTTHLCGLCQQKKTLRCLIGFLQIKINMIIQNVLCIAMVFLQQVVCTTGCCSFALQHARLCFWHHNRKREYKRGTSRCGDPRLRLGNFLLFLTCIPHFLICFILVYIPYL